MVVVVTAAVSQRGNETTVHIRARARVRLLLLVFCLELHFYVSVLFLL